MSDSSLDILPLLSASIRIADIHDSAHTPGATVGTFSEDRGENSMGLWLEIATKLLQYLYEENIEANEGWVSVLPFISDICSVYDVSEQDVQFVIGTLSTPTRLTIYSPLPDSELATSKTTKNTALVQRPHNQMSSRARLTDVGMRTILLSRTAQKWLYASHDAQKILSAIDLGDFSSIPQLCLNLSQSIQSFAHDIRRVIERPGMDEVVESFRRDAEKYLDTIKQVQQGVIAARSLFSLRHVQEAFELWFESQHDTAIDERLIQRSLSELMQSVEALSRIFNELIASAMGNNRDVAGCVRFDKAAIQIACHTPSREMLQSAFSSIGPWATSLAFPSPDDFVGRIKTKEKAVKVESVVLDSNSHPALPTAIDRFMQQYRDQIIERLPEGPISIADAIENGRAEFDGNIFSGQLVGVFSSPDWPTNFIR